MGWLLVAVAGVCYGMFLAQAELECRLWLAYRPDLPAVQVRDFVVDQVARGRRARAWLLEPVRRGWLAWL